jgi:2'-5' RNA ligase
MRLFVAVDLPAPAKDELARAGEILRGVAPDAKWVPRDNLHLTVKFLGEVPDERVGEMSAAVGEVAAGFVDFTSHLEGVGCFPSERRARVLWVGLADPAGGIEAIAAALDESFEPLGFPREKRAFTAHLTLARLRVPRPVGDLPDVALDPTPFPIERLTLFRSHLGRPAPRYEAFATFPFRREPSPPRPD